MIKNICGFRQNLDIVNKFDGQLIYGASRFNFETSRAGLGNPSSGYMTSEQMKIIQEEDGNYSRKKQEEWISVNSCPVCEGVDQVTIIKRMGLVFVQCQLCSHVFQNPVIKQQKAIELYKDDRTASKIYTNKLQRDIDSLKYSYGLDLICKYSGYTPSKILDIGCGAGVFLNEAVKVGVDKCVGIDANENYSDRYSDSTGIHFINSDFEGLSASSIGSDFECITMWSVLEHIYSPSRFIESLKDILSPQGLVFVLVPNFKSLATRIIRSQSPCFNWKHPHYFHLETLNRIFADRGFVNLHAETVISEIENIKAYMNGDYPYHGSKSQDDMFPFITPEYLHTNLLGSRLIAIYKLGA